MASLLAASGRRAGISIHVKLEMGYEFAPPERW